MWMIDFIPKKYLKSPILCNEKDEYKRNIEREWQLDWNVQEFYMPTIFLRTKTQLYVNLLF